ncbi:MAG: ABC transporter permease [Bacilli bacterium]
MKKNDNIKINKEDFEFVQNDKKLYDQKFETKRIGYFADAMQRFSQNKGSIVAGVILLIMIMFSVIAPFVSGYEAQTRDDFYTYCLPKVQLFEGTGFWDGTKTEVTNEKFFAYYESYGAVRSYTVGEDEFGEKQYTIVRDTYIAGCVYKTFSAKDFVAMDEYDKSIENLEDKIFQPLIDTSWIDTSTNNGMVLENLYKQNANYSYKLTMKMAPIFVTDDDGNQVLDYCYLKDDAGNYVYSKQDGNTYSTRLNYDNYYKYLHNGNSPYFTLGSDQYGRDIMTRLAIGGRLSLTLGFTVSLVNIILGVVYGAIEGYYGGATDIVMERISEILSEVPFMIVVTLFSLYLADVVNPVISLFLAFVVTGWIGTAATTRMQFYRYKGQEYVLAARTLGARDSRLIFKHILPNAVGPIITSSVLMIPSVIFSESSLSYLKIIDFSTGNITSIGTMLSEGQATFMTYPNLILWPAIFISLLMICFNIFGNGLRDAFNPQLRGAE